MFRVSRQWATPLAMSMFMLMAVTGLLMFFHADRGLQKVAHEWFGWFMVAAVAAHAAANWSGFKRYLQFPGPGLGALSIGALLLAGSFFVVPQDGGDVSPPVLALRAISKAPLKDVAALAGRPVEQVRRDLANAGIRVEGDELSLDSAVAGDRQKLGQALRILFPQAPG